ncbi:hypothetical protein KP509_23G060600 [Ceratopteris richardii]|uniref:rRNA-processing protein EFG1 n=1 Tax=Ceratopteris richardii TaxID=49495 RepID=A0A8T2S3J9_CERRI|nr:hypothetical protein KP509_23G060600 [Ceratopteris richardii]
MAHGGFKKQRTAEKPMVHKGKNPTGVKRPFDKTTKKKKKKKNKLPSIKNQMRSIERLLRKDLPSEVQDAQKKLLEALKKQEEEHKRSELERKMSIRYRRVKFFERRKIERRIKRVEKLLVAMDASDPAGKDQTSHLSEQLAQLKEDLEYVRFFPRSEKYVSLFIGNEDMEVIAKRNKLREQIKANIAAAAASGVDLEETDIDNVPAATVNDDDFFLAESSSDDDDMDGHHPIKPSKSGAPGKKELNITAKLNTKPAPSCKIVTSKGQHNLGGGSKMHGHRQSVMSRQKKLQDDRSDSFRGSHKRWSWSDNTMNPAKRGDTKFTENSGTHKVKKANRVAPSNNTSLSYGKSLQGRHLPAPSKAMQTENSVKHYSNLSTVLPSASLDSRKVSENPNLGSPDVDTKKKRRRKHRPKKKKA